VGVKRRGPGTSWILHHTAISLVCWFKKAKGATVLQQHRRGASEAIMSIEFVTHKRWHQPVTFPATAYSHCLLPYFRISNPDGCIPCTLERFLWNFQLSEGVSWSVKYNKVCRFTEGFPQLWYDHHMYDRCPRSTSHNVSAAKKQ